MGCHALPLFDLPGAVALMPGGRGGTWRPQLAPAWYCLELEADAAAGLASATLPLPHCFGSRFQGADAAAFCCLGAGIANADRDKRFVMQLAEQMAILVTDGGDETCDATEYAEGADAAGPFTPPIS